MIDITTSESQEEIQYGYCQCGCGQKTKILQFNCAPDGLIKGEPRKFIYGHQNRRFKRSAVDCFWEKVSISTFFECWEWQGGKKGNGYGEIGIGKKNIAAHRFSYELHNGPIPENLHVCHTCDNPSCVNPAHLFLGTPAENHLDKTRKGRANPPREGGSKYRGRFMTNDVLSIREHYANGERIIDLANAYGVTPGAIRHIVRRLTWKHV